MTKNVKAILILIDLLGLIACCLWFYFDRNWESLSVIIFTTGALIGLIFKKPRESSNEHIRYGVNHIIDTSFSDVADYSENVSLEKRKMLTQILFVDDDTKFKVVSILKNAGWVNTKTVKDISNYDDPSVSSAEIIFVDIQGVGKQLQTRDEGLGLALHLKKKYPDKKIVIYSAETQGDRFHEALRKADGFLPKNAEPYEFQQLVEQFSSEIHG
jgi:hypothetical protein